MGEKKAVSWSSLAFGAVLGATIGGAVGYGVRASEESQRRVNERTDKLLRGADEAIEGLRDPPPSERPER